MMMIVSTHAHTDAHTHTHTHTHTDLRTCFEHSALEERADGGERERVVVKLITDIEAQVDHIPVVRYD